MSATELQNQGRQAYRHGDFNKALDYFNRALGRQQTVQLYDNRAATYEKLNDLRKALADAKGAIRTGDVDPTGYLRAGRVLMKMEKLKAALDTYAYGLRHVKHVGQGYEHLKKFHDELQAQLAPTNSVDPLTVLPRELAISMLEYCSFRQRIAVCRVSKGWQTFMRSEPGLWTHLDLGAARTKKVKTSFVSVAINAGKQKLTAATLSNLFDFDKVLHALLRHCPLEVLTLAQTGLQGSNLLDALEKVKDRLVLRELSILRGTEISQTTLREAVRACQNTLEVLHCAFIKSISFHNGWDVLALPKLKSLSITLSQTQGMASGLPRLLANAPQLTSLTLINVESIANVDMVGGPVALDLRGSGLQHVNLQSIIIRAEYLQLPKTIKTLRLGNPGIPFLSFFPISPEPYSLQLRDLPKLEEAHFDLSPTPLRLLLSQFGSENATDDAPPLSNLRALSIKGCCIDNLELYEMPARLKDLRSLALSDIYNLSDQLIVRIVKGLPLLRSLDVSGSAITGAGIGDLLKLGQLSHLTLNDCHRISHRDAIDRARAAGIRVEYSISNPARTGGASIAGWRWP